MKKLLPLLLLLLNVSVFAQKTFNYHTDFRSILDRTKDSSDALYYNKLLVRFKANDTTLTDYDVLALMIGFTAKPAYKPYDDLQTERDIYRLNGEDQYQQALDKANAFLETHPLDLKVLFEKSFSFHQMEQSDSAEYYAYKGKRIFDAMYFSGDGMTKERPCFALGPADGQEFIFKFVNAEVGKMASGHDSNGFSLDILEAKFEDGEKMTIYFIIQHATEKMFGGQSVHDVLDKREQKNR